MTSTDIWNRTKKFGLCWYSDVSRGFLNWQVESAQMFLLLHFISKDFFWGSNDISINRRTLSFSNIRTVGTKFIAPQCRASLSQWYYSDLSYTQGTSHGSGSLFSSSFFFYLHLIEPRMRMRQIFLLWWSSVSVWIQWWWNRWAFYTGKGEYILCDHCRQYILSFFFNCKNVTFPLKI